MTDLVDIRPDHLRIVQNVLRDHLPAGVKTWVFGSRAQWSAREGSDLDLALEGEIEIDRTVIEALADAFEDSDLPYTVDVVDTNRITKRFRHIVASSRVPLPIASDWRPAHWGEFVTLEYGRALRGYRDSVGPFRVFGTNGPIGWHNEPLCPHPSVIIGRKGAYRGVHYSPEPFFAIDTAFYLKPKTDIDMRWAYYQLLTQDINGMDSGSAIPSTSREEFYLLPLSLPPLSEQCAIAEVLGTLDDKIELNRRMNETLEEMARALFKSWFVDFDPVRAKMDGRWKRGESLPGLPAELYDLFPANLTESKLGNVPEGWAIGTLGDIAVSPNRTVSPAEVPPETPYIGLQQMPRRSLALDRWEDAGQVSSNKSVFRQGALLFGKLRPYFHKIGIAPVAGIASTDIVVVEPIAPDWSGLAACHLSSDEFVAYTDRTSTGTRMPRTSWPVMKQYTICLPSEAVATEFQNIVGPLLDHIVQNCNASHGLYALQNVLLPKLISGEIQANHVRDEM